MTDPQVGFARDAGLPTLTIHARRTCRVPAGMATVTAAAVSAGGLTPTLNALHCL